MKNEHVFIYFWINEEQIGKAELDRSNDLFYFNILFKFEINESLRRIKV